MRAVPQSDLSQVIAPVAKAKGLPNAHYTDPAVFAEEREALLFGNWSGIGFVRDVPERGYAKPVDFLGVPLLIVRGDGGEVRVFQNTCRHRGMILMDKPGNIRGTIRCPYHSWCYGLDGALRSTPHVGGPGQNLHEDIRRDELGLVEFPSKVFRGVIFVNVSGTAPDFDSYAAKLTARWSEHDATLYPGTGNSFFTLDVATNWKLAVENFCESYHLPWIHPGLNAYSRLEDHYHIEEPGAFAGQGTYVYQQIKDDAGQSFPDFAGLSDFWDEGAEYIAFFPNVLFGAQRDHAFAMILMPVALDRTIEMTGLFYAFDPQEAPERAEMIEANAAQWKTVFEEDIFVVEGMQKGRHGPLFDGGKFSPVMDNPTHVFHAWAADKILAARAQRGA